MEILKNPQFYVSRVSHGLIAREPAFYAEKRINIYELEFYTEDHPGGTLTDGVFRPAVKGSYCIFKPGQRQTLVPPYQCYVLNIVSTDPELRKQLNALPTFSMLWNKDEVISLLQQMLLLKDQDTLQNRLRLHCYAAQILSLLIDNNQLPAHSDLNVQHHQEVLLAADRYIREHLDEDLSLNQLAQQSNLDPTYFHKLFTAAFGVTPAKQVLNYRIAGVKAGLLDGKLSRSALALQYGFSTPSYLSAKFHQVTGMTLTQYRKAHQENK